VSLRARLTIVAVALVAAGLLVANLATYHYLSGFLTRRVDQQLAAAQRPAAGQLFGPTPGGGPGPEPDVTGSVYVAFIDPTGQTLDERFLPYGHQASPPSLPNDVHDQGDLDPAFFTTKSVDGRTTYRVLARNISVSGTSGTMIEAIPMTDVAATLRRLMAAELLVSISVLGLVAALALWFVRIGLQPLEGMGETAGAIAAGDLTRRVEPADDKTEVGRLGLALNTMLSQIESAFEQRRRSEERLRRFVADASHELRTPLTSIRGYAELFRRGADTRPEDLAKSMTNIEAEAARMGVLVDDMLLLARLDQGRPLEQESLDLSAVVREAVETARTIDPTRAIELGSHDPAAIVGDAGRLRQVIDNLLENARVHAPGAAVQVKVDLDGDDAVVEVADEGPGIEPEVVDRIFERFTRGDPSRSRGTGGAGLGLSIAAAIVDAHGGSVRASAREGGGSVFRVRLPVRGPAEQPRAPDAGDPSDNGTPGVEG